MAEREVKTETFTILGQKHSLRIVFDSKREVFRIIHPKAVAEVVESTDTQGSTMAEARTRFKTTIAEYGERVKTRRKVIVFETDSKVLRQDPYRGEERGDGGFWGQKEFDYHGFLEVRFFIGFETTRLKEKEYRDENGHRPDNDIVGYDGALKQGARVVDWTQEREDFFRGMIDSIERAQARMESIFGKKGVRWDRADEEKTENIVSRIDAAGNNLLGFDAKELVR